MKNLVLMVAGLVCFSFELYAQTSVTESAFKGKLEQSNKHKLENFVIISEMEGGSGITTDYLNKTATSTPPFIAPAPEPNQEIISSNKTATSTPASLDSSSTDNIDKATTASAAFPDPLPNGCALTQTNQSVPFPTAAVDLESFFIIQSKALWLPEKPSNPDATIAGVDVDGDCVRDDIEHYIARKYGAKSQYKLRKYLYEYTAWMDTFLIQYISVSAAKYAWNHMAEAGECISREVADNTSQEIIDDLFAKFHNTFPRTYRYLANLKRTSGWTTRDKIVVSCP